MNAERFPWLDNVRVQVWNVAKSGKHRLDHEFSLHNLITNAGKDLAANRIVGSSPAALGWLAVGTGTTAAAVTDTTLGTEVFRDVFTQLTVTSVGLVTVRYYLGTGSANGNTLAEIGLFNASSSGTMFARALLSPTIVKNSSKAVTFTWLITNA